MSETQNSAHSLRVLFYLINKEELDMLSGNYAFTIYLLARKSRGLATIRRRLIY
jgi:hypothetical protein